MQSRTFNASPLQSHITSTTRSYQSNGESRTNATITHAQNNNTAEGFDDGPTFKEALRAFQGDSNSSGLSSTNTSFSKVNRSFNESKQIMTSTTQQFERTMHTTSSNKSYHVEESWKVSDWHYIYFRILISSSLFLKNVFCEWNLFIQYIYTYINIYNI